jgi:hypothetical protein
MTDIQTPARPPAPVAADTGDRGPVDGVDGGQVSIDPRALPAVDITPRVNAEEAA